MENIIQQPKRPNKIRKFFIVFFTIIGIFLIFSGVREFIATLNFGMLCDDGTCIVDFFAYLLVTPFIIFLLWQPRVKKWWKKILHTILLTILWCGALFLIALKIIGDWGWHDNMEMGKGSVMCPPGQEYYPDRRICE